VESRLGKLEDATDSQVLVLEKLDLLKRNMEVCGDTLLEAANWSQLVREIHASFAAQVWLSSHHHVTIHLRRRHPHRN
jgi:hypothetical protein